MADATDETGTPDASNDDKESASEHVEDDSGRSDDEAPRASFRGRLGDGLLNSLLDSGSAIKRGQDLVTGLAGGTKEEIVRIVGSEVRGFLDKMDIVDLAQEVVSGLVIDVNAQIRFSRDREGNLQPEIAKRKTTLRDAAAPVDGEAPPDEESRSEPADSNEE